MLLIILILARMILYMVEPDNTVSILVLSESRILIAYTLAESLVSQRSFSLNESEKTPKITKKIVIPSNDIVIGMVGINGRESDLIPSKI